jgi:phosphatidylglycerophosphate synthase
MIFRSDNQTTFIFYKISELEQNVPNLISILRIIVLPHLVYAFHHGYTPLVYTLFLFAISTDLIDGYVARKLNAQSKVGAYLDVTVDFVFISGIYLVFISKGLYSPWLLVITSAIFFQFILTNLYSNQTIYDPIGKYYGSLLLGGIGLTLIFQGQMVCSIVTIGIITSTIICILSRILYFLNTIPQTRKHKCKRKTI